jgi:hypothetical protein
MPGIITHSFTSSAIDKIAFVLDLASRLLCILFTNIRIRELQQDKTVQTILLHSFSVSLSIAMISLGSISVHLREDFPIQSFRFLYMLMDVIASLAEYVPLIVCLRENKVLNTHPFEIIKGLFSIVCSTSMSVASIVIFILGADVYKAYYYGLYAGRIAMLEVFNSSVLNDLDRVNDQSTISKSTTSKE